MARSEPSKSSAGLLVYRKRADVPGGVELLVVHPGGPLWAKKDEGAWSVPKGEIDPGDDPAACAAREFEEELGVEPPEGPWVYLGEVRQAGGKLVRAWAVEGDLELDLDRPRSNTFELEWPPRSGRMRAFPEVDRAAWVDAASARGKLNPAQRAFVERLLEVLSGAG